MNKILGFLLSMTVFGCSNANIAAVSAWGKRHDVKCWSGGIVIYEGYTTGRVENEAHSDGYYFQDSESGKFVTVTGNCVITVDSR